LILIDGEFESSTDSTTPLEDEIEEMFLEDAQELAKLMKDVKTREAVEESTKSSQRLKEILSNEAEDI